MKILGISAFYHDSAAAIIIDGNIIAAAQEERFTRIKHDHSFPSNAIKFCLDFANISLNDIDAIAFYDKPLLKFERLLETYYEYSPKGIISFINAIPVWIKEKLFLKNIIYKNLNNIQHSNKRFKILFPEHHLSHAASSFFPSNFNSAAIITIDGVGEWATTTISDAIDNNITLIKEQRFPHSLGLLYSAFTYFLGFVVNSGEYKLMGLAPYGIPNSQNVKNYTNLIYNNIIDVKDDGSIWLNQQYFNYATGLRMINEKKWENIFQMKRRKPDDQLLQHHCDLALAIQNVTEDIIIKLAKETKKITNQKNLCLAGGVALNCVATGKLLKTNIFDNIFIQPAAGDAGGAIGTALAAYHIYFKKPRIKSNLPDLMNGAYLGPQYSENDILKTINKYNAIAQKYNDFDHLCDITADLIAEGKVIGWFQDRMEFGPRALGNRSIIGDARNKDMQKKLNLKIKFREGFRPFAPSVLFEDTENFFDINTPSPYMLIVAPVKENHRCKLPDNYYQLPLMERLYIQRSDIPAITHIDFSARIQTVHKETNPKYWTLINKFKEKTGYGVIVNTSFNVRGEPIVCTPEEAYRCFMRTEMDYLVIQNYIFEKTKQPFFNDKEKWQEKFKLD